MVFAGGKTFQGVTKCGFKVGSFEPTWFETPLNSAQTSFPWNRGFISFNRMFMSNFPKFTFSIIISPVGYPSSAVGFPSSPLGPGWISFQWRDFLPIWRKILPNPRHRIGLIKYHVNPYFFFFGMEILVWCLTGRKRTIEHYYESARDSLRMAGKKESWVRAASRHSPSSQLYLLGQNCGQGRQQQHGRQHGRRPGKGYKWNTLYLIWSLLVLKKAVLRSLCISQNICSRIQNLCPLYQLF